MIIAKKIMLRDTSILEKTLIQLSTIVRVRAKIIVVQCSMLFSLCYRNISHEMTCTFKVDLFLSHKTLIHLLSLKWNDNIVNR